MQDVLSGIFIFSVVVAAVLLCVFLSLWAINDGRRRGKSPLLVWLAGFLFFPCGLLAWLLFRPAPVIRNLPLQPRRLRSIPS